MFSDKRKREVMEDFNTLAATYDSLRFIQRCSNALVERSALPTGARVLDIATGTGWVAMAAARRIGPSGKVIGVDLSAEMLAHARRKFVAAGLGNVEVREGDAERLDFPSQSFDVVLCASSLFFVPDMLATVKEWWRVLVPGGYVSFSGFGSTFHQPLRTLWNARLRRYGLSLPASPPTYRLADGATCRQLLHDAGFGEISVQSEQLGYYLPTVEEWWEENWATPMRMPLLQLTPDQQARFKSEHLAEVASLATDQGIWVDVAANFAFGRKQ